MLGRTLIFCGGTMNLTFAEQYIRENDFDTVVCADSGLNAAYQLGVPVDFFLGDFDSVAPDVLEIYRKRRQTGIGRAEWLQYPGRKDATDTHLLLDWIVEKGADEIVLLGATGGRLDHFLSNLNLLMIPLRHGIRATIADPQNRIYLIDRDTVIRREKAFGKYISLQPLTSEVTGITLRGFCYPLDDFTMAVGSSRGISNELAEDSAEAQIHLKDGVLVVIESKD